MSIKQIRLSSQAKEQLIRLKTRTGIQQWNILCRWALCWSLKEPTPPTPIEIPADSNVEMRWHVFGGDCHELYMGSLKERCVRDGLDTLAETLSRQFRLHLHRGISYLATPNTIRSGIRRHAAVLAVRGARPTPGPAIAQPNGTIATVAESRMAPNDSAIRS